MRTLFCVVLLIFSAPVFASGRVLLKPSVNAETKDQTYTLALSVYEPMLAGISYVGYLGVGERVDTFRGNWVKTEQGLEMAVGKAAIGVGVNYKYTPSSKIDAFGYHGTISITLW